MDFFDDEVFDAGVRLRAERKRLGLTQEQMADAVGIKKQSQLRYESGKSSPTLEYLFRLQRLGANIAYILTGAAGGLDSREEEVLLKFRHASDDTQRAVLGVLASVVSREDAPDRETQRIRVGGDNNGHVVIGSNNKLGGSVHIGSRRKRSKAPK
ncbi:helix-turn-helix transcriptional regulator [Stenotrophomonas sp. B1-1]|uniref:helix-turn-helix domain-containing protein n=1 Tax=Stenotrophomonas sp. B1-1 TaxID=2710648 RepID=UPI0013DD3E33|nr:helix-turn-helix transcriptional regulator [Stenotrophomonas sp. B1-1]